MRHWEIYDLVDRKSSSKLHIIDMINIRMCIVWDFEIIYEKTEQMNPDLRAT